MLNTNTQRFAFWPCGTFCPLADVEMYDWMSDDYEVKDFDSDKEALAYIDKVVFNNIFISRPQAG